MKKFLLLAISISFSFALFLFSEVGFAEDFKVLEDIANSHKSFYDADGIERSGKNSFIVWTMLESKVKSQAAKFKQKKEIDCALKKERTLEFHVWNEGAWIVLGGGFLPPSEWTPIVEGGGDEKLVKILCSGR